MFEKSSLFALRHKLSASLSLLNNSNIVVGFDGYIDKLVNMPNSSGYFSSISEFVSHISGYKNQSADMKVRFISEKLGGNGPLLAESIAAKGGSVTCIGAMGEPEVLEQFLELAKNCNVISVEQPASCFAIEFADGKLMFGDTDSLERITYESLVDKIGLEQFAELINKCDLFCFTNWSGMPHANELLSGIIADICPRLCLKPRSLFFDLADPSAQTKAQFTKFFGLLASLQRYFNIIVGFNPKELLLIYNKFFDADEAEITSNMMPDLLSEFPADELVLHGLDYAVTSDKAHGTQRVPGMFVKSPIVVTGGGDNFNAGYCTGRLLGLSPSESALLGNLSSMLYVKSGIPAGLSDIIELLRTFD